VVVLVYIPTNSVRGFLFPRILANTCWWLCTLLHFLTSTLILHDSPDVSRGQTGALGRDMVETITSYAPAKYPQLHT
jgi:hypothetical protein